MKQRKILIGTVAVAAAGVCWYLFRPELLFVNKSVNESLPGVQSASAKNEPVMLTAGRFRGIAHETKGTATIYSLADAKRILRLTGFSTSNGPDVHVYLVAAPDAKDNDTVKEAGFIDLGSIKGNQGDQNYDVPGSVDLEQYRAVTIWCARFKVNFGTAPLSAVENTASAPKSLSEGRFHSVAHDTEGTAAVYEVAGGKRLLRLSDFKTSNGPDVHVYLVASPDAKDNDTVKKAGFIDLGSIKGNQGDQNYDLPSNLDLNRYQAVTIWCARFKVNFGTAPLSGARTASR